MHGSLGTEVPDVLCCAWLWLAATIVSQVLMLLSPSSQPLTGQLEVR